MRYTIRQYAETLYDMLCKATDHHTFAKYARSFLQHLKTNAATRLLPKILRRIEEIESRKERGVPLVVRGGESLSREMHKTLADIFGGREIREVQNPKVLGGLTLTWNDFRIDGSIRGRLQKLQFALHK